MYPIILFFAIMATIFFMMAANKHKPGDDDDFPQTSH